MIRGFPTQHCRNRLQNERPAVRHFTRLLANRVFLWLTCDIAFHEKAVGVKGILGS